jgi:hypothetical protein
VSSRRTIRPGTYSAAGYVILCYRQEHDLWYVTTPSARRCSQRHKRQPPGPHTHAVYRRAILPPFRSAGAAILAAHKLVADAS